MKKLLLILFLCSCCFAANSSDTSMVAIVENLGYTHERNGYLMVGLSVLSFIVSFQVYKTNKEVDLSYYFFGCSTLFICGALEFEFGKQCLNRRK